MDTPPLSPTGPPRPRRARFSCRRIDRMCCSVLSYFPLLFVSGTMTWAVYTYSWSICWTDIAGVKGTVLGLLGFVLYFLANWAYLHAVFTNPGSPLGDKHTYATLPTTEPSSITVKSSGQARFCKKCQCYKPDRTHHCSSCRTCVLKMDHHCPWLANCLGLYNYKAFLLFLIYTSLFSILSFCVSALHIYLTLLSDPQGTQSRYESEFTPVNWVLLCVIAGIIGLVLTGFTIWHLTLVGAGMTTIESLEKARYTHTPTLSHRPPAPLGANRLYDDNTNYAAEELAAEHRRYNDYLSDETARSLPHPFDLGRARNFRAVFGPAEKWYLWFLPRFSGLGDGWNWETSHTWRIAAEQARSTNSRPYQPQQRGDENHIWGGGVRDGLVKLAGGGGGARGQSKAERVLGKKPGSYSDGENVPLKRMDASDEESEDEFFDLQAGLAEGRRGKMVARSAGSVGGWGGWDRDVDVEENW